MSDDDKVAQMRKEINIELVRDAQNAGITAFRIDYSAQDPRVAQQVTGQLADLFISENQQTLLQQSGDTTKFLEGELEKASADLADMDARKKAFEASHLGALPSQEASNLQILTGLQAQLTNEQDALNNATQQRALHQTMIEQLRTNPSPAPRATEVDPNGVQAIDTQLAKLRDQLTDLQSRYTDSYPDVVKVKAQIARTEKQRQAAVAAEKAKGTTTASNDTMTMSQLQGQLESDQVEIQNRGKEIAALQARIAEYEARINAEPASEQQARRSHPRLRSVKGALRRPAEEEAGFSDGHQHGAESPGRALQEAGCAQSAYETRLSESLEILRRRPAGRVGPGSRFGGLVRVFRRSHAQRRRH